LSSLAQMIIVILIPSSVPKMTSELVVSFTKVLFVF
jgi:hypothetical protein